MGRTRPVDRPYLIFTDERSGWEWRVLKAYALDPDKPYARWFCSVSSPYTFGGSDMGDTYVSDVGGVLTHRDPAVPDSALPRDVRQALDAASVRHVLGLLGDPRR